MSADGSVVVGFGVLSDSGVQAAFVWDSANGMRDLQNFLATDLGLDLAGWSLEQAEAVSADGRTIVGYGTNPSGRTEAWIAIIPEPSTALLLASGLVALAMGRRHRRRSNNLSTATRSGVG